MSHDSRNALLSDHYSRKPQRLFMNRKRRSRVGNHARNYK